MDGGISLGLGSAISGGGSLLGGMFGKNSAQDAARIQARAANNAANLQALGFQYTAQQLQPYNMLGQSLISPYWGGVNELFNTTSKSLTPLTDSLAGIGFPTGAVTTPQTTHQITPTLHFTPNSFFAPVTTAQGVSQWGLGADQQKALENTPGYQFTREQGLQGVQNASAATGRGVSGNALAGAANYATGLANTTFNQQYENMLRGQQQAFSQGLQSSDQALRAAQEAFAQQLGLGQYNLGAQQQNFAQQLAHAQALQGLEAQRYAQTRGNIYDPINALLQAITLGQNAAAMTGANANNAANNIGNSLIGGANATASGIIGGNNALFGGIGGASNALMNYLLFNNMFSGGNFGNSNYYGGPVDFGGPGDMR